MNQMPNLQDLEIQQCIPNCGGCPGVWTNYHIGHNIVCRCKCHEVVFKSDSDFTKTSLELQNEMNKNVKIGYPAGDYEK